MLNNFQRILFNSYKSFQKKGISYCIDVTSCFNLIIGRNNCGKSSLMDVIQAVFQYKENKDECMIDSDGYYKKIENINLDLIIDKKHLKDGFSINTSNDYLDSSARYAVQFIDKLIRLKLIPSSLGLIGIINNGKIVTDWQMQQLTIPWNKVAKSYYDSLSDIKFLRINAERDIVPEYESDSEYVSFNGSGATNLIRKFVNYSEYSEAIVEGKLLCELNSILGQDTQYSSIRVQQVDEDKSEDNRYKWEIFLSEGDNRFALSKSGSGLKTIILVLVNLYLIPKRKDYKGKQIVYVFEELENNLHPTLQRRLFEYLFKYSESNPVKIFLTSHSPVAINALFGKRDSKIYHVIKDNKQSSIKEISTGEKIQVLLEDIGVKASDLLQANGIIWVEGPSDRIYINKWLQIFCDNKFVEGKDYQFLFYGGRLLSHYTAKQYDDCYERELLNMLSINRHSAIIIDSDKKYKSASINQTKKRIQKEFHKNHAFCWITKGKEIENYLSAEAINNVYNSKLKQIGQYEFFPDYINKYNKNFSNEKVKVSKQICDYLTRENERNILDLKQRIEELYMTIKGWNREEYRNDTL